MAQARRSLAALARAMRAGNTTKSVPEEILAVSPSTLAARAQNSTGVRSLVTFTKSNLVSGGTIRRGFSSGITYPASEAFVGKPAPNFSATAVVGGEFSPISLDDYKGKWVCLFFYPKDWTFVCPTEIIAFSDRAKEFEELGCQLIAASTDTEESHLAWIKTPRRKGGLGSMQIPVLADTTKEIAAKYGCLIPDLGIALRGLYIINPEGVLEQIIVNNLPIGRSVDEAKRLLQAIQFVREHGEVCPAGWTPGAATMVADPERSMEYFAQQEEQVDEISPGLPSLTSPQSYQEALSDNHKVVIDFYAPWCGKCKMISPTVEALAEANPSVKFFKVDTTGPGMEELKDSLGVKALPTFKFYKAGSEAVDEVIGYKKRPLEDAVNELVGK